MDPERGFIYVSRRLVFSSAHRLHHPELDNEAIYGNCANLHGHNYTLEVMVKGKIDEKTGFVVDLKKLKQIMEEKVKIVLDHKNIDCDVEYFKDITQSAENITVFIWNQLVDHIPTGAELYRIRLHETENNMIEYFG